MNSIIISFIGALTIMAYQPWESKVMFNHQAHFADRNIECTTCHDVAKSTSSADKNISGHDVCSQCHSVDKAPGDCKLCHADPDNPKGVTWHSQELIFSHQRHLNGSPASQECLSCHDGVDKQQGKLIEANLPAMQDCFKCHDGVKAEAECKTCHTQPEMVRQLIHPQSWRHEHKFDANAKADHASCNPCHHAENFCSDCHADDNLTGFAHELNYRWNHGIDAKGKEFKCQTCHDNETFCTPCHDQGTTPLDHFHTGWVNPPYEHANAARRDIEYCAACHSDGTPCSNANCHHEGTQRSIHDASIKDLGHGPWHDDPTFQCFQCHIDTHQPGVGFCGNCHGEKGD